MRPRWTTRRLSVLPVAVASAAFVLWAQGSQTAAAGNVSSARPARAAVAPGAVGELDCNGLSPIQRRSKPAVLCADPRGRGWRRLYDTGTTSGTTSRRPVHLQSPGSGATLPVWSSCRSDPAALPTVSKPGKDVTHWFELRSRLVLDRPSATPTPLRWLPCTRARTRTHRRQYLGGGRRSWSCSSTRPASRRSKTRISCDNTHWCSALTIDSLECTGGRAVNNNCIEPVNFAWIQTNGVPTGPPSPQRVRPGHVHAQRPHPADEPGDTIRPGCSMRRSGAVMRWRPPRRDLTTGRAGTMVASAANGFMTTTRRLHRHAVQLRARLLHGARAEHHSLGHRPLHASTTSSRSATSSLAQRSLGSVRSPIGQLHRHLLHPLPRPI